MKIRINGVDADVQPETEKTVGEILYAMDAWLAGTGYRLSGLDIDDKTINIDSMETCFGRNIDTIDTLNIKARSVLELFAECLFRLIQDIDAYTAAGFEEKSSFVEHWRETPEARLLEEQSHDLFDQVVKTFSGEGTDPQSLRILVEERLRELQDPEKEMNKTGPVVAEICSRLEELPLDIQTGKDTRAAETVSIFSGIAEKVFRIFNLLKTKGFPVGEITVANMPITAYITEFGTALRELLAAYEQHDTVLVGDIAEYEMAPRLRSLHSAVLDGISRRGP
jgi:anti-anti-sigma regulatory factor